MNSNAPRAKKRRSSATNPTNLTFDTTPDAISPGQPVGLSTGNATVDKIGQMHFEGNIVDHRWRLSKRLRHPNGKLNSVALDVLADLIYWHRPTIVRDPQTGAVVEVRKKFETDAFYRDYDQWAEHLGYTKRQVQDAVAFLVARGIITRETAQITFRNGFKTNNLPLLTPIPEAIRAITYGTPFPDENGEKEERATKAPKVRVTTPKNRRKSAAPSESSKVEKRDLAPAEREAPHVITEGPSRPNVKPNAPQREAPNAKAGHHLMEIGGECERQQQQQENANFSRDFVAVGVVVESSIPLPQNPESEQWSATDESGQTYAVEVERYPLVQQLRDAGVSRNIAEELAQSAPDEARQQLLWLPYRVKEEQAKGKTIGRVGAFLRRAIEQGYGVPDLLIVEESTAAARAKKQERRAEADSARAQAEAQEVAEKARQEEELSQLAAYYANLPEPVKAEIDDSAKRRVAPLVAAGFNVQSAFEAERRELLRREMGLAA